MADEVISTPVETSSVDTSASVEPTDTVDTSTVEPTTEEVAAEIDTEDAEQPAETVQEPKLYAGKYKSVEELEKGYEETQKAFNQVADLKKQIEAMNKAQAEKEQKAQLEALRVAQQRGFDTVEAQEIADKVQVAELEYYANNLNQVTNVEDYENARLALLSYYQTGQKEYLNEAKKYFTDDFKEKVTIAKNDLQARLKSEYQQKQDQLRNQSEQALAETLRGEYGEFLESIKEDEGVSEALKAFCNTGHIQSKEDMKTFIDIVGKIQSRAKEQAIKEYEAQKAIEETKEKAVIEAGSGADNVEEGKIPTLAQINAMTQAQYEEAYAKYGDKLLLAN